VLPSGLPVEGAVLSDHVRSADWRDRGSEYIAAAPPELLDEVRAKLLPLLGA
jgi:mRNA interferase MazF